MNLSEKPAMRRFFVGIELDEAARDACAEAARLLLATGFAARYEDPAKFHLTLAFLGNVDAARSGEIVAAVRQAAAQLAPFAINLDKLGAFPHERKPRVIYAGAREQGADFRRLAQGVREVLQNCGFDFANDSVAHVTLARVKEPTRPLPLVEIAPIPLRCDGLSLFESIFDKEKNTSRYEAFFREKLGNRQ